MSEYCIIVADTTRARLLSLETSTRGDGQTHLVERLDLVNSELRAARLERHGQRRSDALGQVGGHHYVMSDHREQHDHDADERFAGEVIEEAARLSRSLGARQALVCAEPRMLGLIRPSEPLLEKQGVLVKEVPRDLMKTAASELKAYLENAGFLPGHARA